MLPEQIRVDIEGSVGMIQIEKYIEWKTKYLKEFGYDINESEVREQLLNVLDGQEFGKGVNVIGLMIKRDLA